MKFERIGVERTFNTGNYTSHKYRLDVQLEDDEDMHEAMVDLADILYRVAAAAMRKQGVRHIYETSGQIDLGTDEALNDDGDANDIPF